MRKKHTKLMAGLIVLIVCLALLAQIAMAAEPIYVPMPEVSISLTGESPPDSEEYEIILKADDPAYPMPEGSVDGEYKLLITGEGTDIFPEIQFSSLGIYTYTVFQTPGTNELADYDDAVYNITIYIINAPANGGFEYMVTARKAGETEKLSELVFENEYAAEEPVPTPTPTPTPPGEIEIPEEEIPGGEIEEPTPTPMPTPGEIEIPEEEIPGGEAEPPKSDVPKTGDDFLLWPYIVSFVGAGALLMVLGLTGRKKARE